MMKKRDSRPSQPKFAGDAPRWITPELIAQTLETWQPYYAEPLTPEDAVAIIKNVGRLVDVLTREPDK
jgi:hypothetical protein